jgi:site-specific recombinase XerD
MVEIKIKLNMTVDEFRALARVDKKMAASSLNAELESFDAYLESQKMDPMSNVERQIVREFLGWLLVRETPNG